MTGNQECMCNTAKRLKVTATCSASVTGWVGCLVNYTPYSSHTQRGAHMIAVCRCNFFLSGCDTGRAPMADPPTSA